jgi:hypothetical protein
VEGLRLILFYSLRSILRTSFFWAWNGCLLVLILSLNHITYFDFDEDTLVPELFFATFMLCGCANLIVYSLGNIRELSSRQWDLLILRPVMTAQLVLGKGLAFFSLQAAVGLVFAAAYLFDSQWLGRGPGGLFWASWYLALLQIATLVALFSLLSVLLKELLAFLSMVGAFLLGQFSEMIQKSISGHISEWIFCLLPDLDLSLVREGREVPEILTPLLMWKTAYSLFYILSLGYVSSLALRRRLEQP